MSQYYKPLRTYGIFDPQSKQPYKLSRSKLDLFLNCPRCFYMDRRLGVGQPPGYPFNLNSAVDALLKREFDIHRAAGNPHPLMKKYGLDAVPFKDNRMEEWRDAMRRGIQYLHKPTNFLVCGGVDDVWVNPAGELIIVDYKATSKSTEVTLDADWQIGYKRQMEVYQWLFRQNGFAVSDVGYFVYCNGNADKEAFDAKLEFDIKLIPYQGKPDWVEDALEAAKICLTSDDLPKASASCDFCAYRKAAGEVIAAREKKTMVAPTAAVPAAKPVKKKKAMTQATALF
jgi:hypothetical protein